MAITKVVFSQASVVKLVLTSDSLSFYYRHLFKSVASLQSMIQTTNSAILLIPFFVPWLRSMSEYVKDSIFSDKFYVEKLLHCFGFIIISLVYEIF